MAETLQSLGEAELLRRLARFAPPGQLDDDTAQLKNPAADLLINTDVLVENVHFSDATTTAADVGWRAAAANLSDLASSGVDTVLGVTVGLVAPPQTPWSWVEGVYSGIAAMLQSSGGQLLGGDCTRGSERILSITALGTLGPLRLHRNQARAGDWIVVSGAHGLSRLGLGLLQREAMAMQTDLPEALKTMAITRHQRPEPRLDALVQLIECKPKDLAWRAGGTDSSDGLLAAVQNLCQSSGCGAVLEQERLPHASGWPKGEAWREWCLSGGEDFELVLSLPQAWAEAWLTARPESRQVGWITDQPDVIQWKAGGRPMRRSGFDHFQGL